MSAEVGGAKTGRLESASPPDGEVRVDVSLRRILTVSYSRAVDLFLDCDDQDLTEVSREYTPFYTRNVVKFLDEILSRDYTVVGTFGVDVNGRAENALIPPVYRDIEAAPDRFERHLYSGFRLCADRHGRRFILSNGPRRSVRELVRGLRRDEEECWVAVTTKRQERDLAEELFRKLDAEIKARNIFRGAKIRFNGEFLRFKNRTWSDVQVNPSVIEELRKNVLLPLHQPGRFRELGLALCRGVLLEGPPGTGKSLLCSIIAASLDSTFILVTPHDIHTLSDIKNVFDIARELAPTIVLFEDIDVIGDDRHATDSKRLIGELLAQLDSVETREGVFVLATSNRPGMLDKALVDRPGRFDRRILVDLPDKEWRRKILDSALRSKSVEVGADVDMDEVAGASEGFSGAHLHDLIHTAVVEALEGADGAKVLVRGDHFRAALGKVKGYRMQCKEMYV